MSNIATLNKLNSVKKERFVALDLLRGLVIVLLIIVGNQCVAQPWWFLEHAEWIGFTLCDFPFAAFMVCMGFSMVFSLKHVDTINKKFAFKTIRRGVLFIGIGFMFNFMWSYFSNLFNLVPNAFMDTMTHFRVYGVFQRLGFVSMVSAFIIVLTKKDYRWLLGISGVILVAYFFILGFGHGYEASKNNIVYVFDHLIFNDANLYQSKNPLVGLDPEGGLSMLPCIAQVLLSFVISKAYIDHRNKNKKDALIGLYTVSALLIILAVITNSFSPIIKKVWTPTYVFITTGIATLLYALFISLTIKKKNEKYFYFLKVLGMNALAIYIYMNFFTIILTDIPVGVRIGEGVTELINMQYYIRIGFTHMCLGNELCASFIYSILMLGLNWFVAWILYKKEIFIKL